jgi:hypothetical protein
MHSYRLLNVCHFQPVSLSTNRRPNNTLCSKYLVTTSTNLESLAVLLGPGAVVLRLKWLRLLLG